LTSVVLLEAAGGVPLAVITVVVTAVLVDVNLSLLTGVGMIDIGVLPLVVVIVSGAILLPFNEAACA